MREVEIRDESIRLGQFLKLAGLAEDGGHAKSLLEAGYVSVDDEPEERRGRQLAVGSVVSVGSETVRVVRAPARPVDCSRPCSPEAAESPGSGRRERLLVSKPVWGEQEHGGRDGWAGWVDSADTNVTLC